MAIVHWPTSIASPCFRPSGVGPGVIARHDAGACMHLGRLNLGKRFVAPLQPCWAVIHRYTNVHRRQECRVRARRHGQRYGGRRCRGVCVAADGQRTGEAWRHAVVGAAKPTLGVSLRMSGRGRCRGSGESFAFLLLSVCKIAPLHGHCRSWIRSATVRSWLQCVVRPSNAPLRKRGGKDKRPMLSELGGSPLRLTRSCDDDVIRCERY